MAAARLATLRERIKAKEKLESIRMKARIAEVCQDFDTKWSTRDVRKGHDQDALYHIRSRSPPREPAGKLINEPLTPPPRQLRHHVTMEKVASDVGCGGRNGSVPSVRDEVTKDALERTIPDPHQASHHANDPLTPPRRQLRHCGTGEKVESLGRHISKAKCNDGAWDVSAKDATAHASINLEAPCLSQLSSEPVARPLLQQGQLRAETDGEQYLKELPASCQEKLWEGSRRSRSRTPRCIRTRLSDGEKAAKAATFQSRPPLKSSGSSESPTPANAQRNSSPPRVTPSKQALYTSCTVKDVRVQSERHGPSPQKYLRDVQAAALNLTSSLVQFDGKATGDQPRRAADRTYREAEANKCRTWHEAQLKERRLSRRC